MPSAFQAFHKRGADAEAYVRVTGDDRAASTSDARLIIDGWPPGTRTVDCPTCRADEYAALHWRPEHTRATLIACATLAVFGLGAAAWIVVDFVAAVKVVGFAAFATSLADVARALRDSRGRANAFDERDAAGPVYIGKFITRHAYGSVDGRDDDDDDDAVGGRAGGDVAPPA